MSGCYTLGMKAAAPSVRLNSGMEMPALGFGTWNIAEGEKAYTAVSEALRAGYRHIDTAHMYGNERSVGRAVRDSAFRREEIFVTTKLLPTDILRPEKAFYESLEKLDIGYIDLYLIHWPVPEMPSSVWRALQNVHAEKLARSIGVSNYGIGDIEKLLAYATVPPAVNQIKFSPFDYQQEVLKLCKERDIAVEAYSPLTRGSHLGDAAVAGIAQKYGKTPAQVMLRWCVEHGAVPLPKTTRPERMRENLAIFDWKLDEPDVAALDELS